MTHEREIRHADGRIEHPDAPFEEKDIHYGCILALVIAVGCVFAVMFVVDWYFFGAVKREQAQSKQSPYSFAPSGAAPLPLPPPPRLDGIDHMQTPPSESYHELHVAMEHQLHASGPADEKGFVHIPIEQAMKEIVSQLPVRKQPAGEAANPVHAGSSNSGRMLPGAPLWSEY